MSDEYYIYQQRKTDRKDLPVLESGIFGFTPDTSQLFIGSDPNQSPYTHNGRIEIYPIPNAKGYVQGLLDNSVSYKSYTVTEDLYIVTESQEKAEEIVGFINDKVLVDFTNVRPIARLSRNIEIITTQNVIEHTNPAYFNVDLSPTIGFSRPDQRVLTKTLDGTLADTFLEFPRYDALNIEVKYTLVQNGGFHRRSGVITVCASKSLTDEFDVACSDVYSSMQNYDPNHLKFSASNYHIGDKVRVNFSQPAGHSSLVHYRIQKWGMDDF